MPISPPALRDRERHQRGDAGCREQQHGQQDERYRERDEAERECVLAFCLHAAANLAHP
jgi:hypothetical protein